MCVHDSAVYNTRMSDQSSELEVQFKPESGKAVIEGKTVVPFQAFVALILQRKVTNLLKVWGKHPVIIESELLTSLASASQESVENKSNLILVSIVAGVLVGIAGFALAQIGLLFAKIPLGYMELGTIAGSIGLLVILMYAMMKMQRKPKGEKLVETMEKVSGFLSKK
jgi:hypothetical protein